MGRWLLRAGFVVLGVGVLVGVSLLPFAPFTSTTGAQIIIKPPVVQYTVFDIDTPYLPGQGWQIPSNGSTWHELWPTFCTPHVQGGYADNGDGVVSICDNIIVGPGEECWHVTDVTTTYWFSCVYHPNDLPFEAEVHLPPDEPGSPICRTLHIVHPDYCTSIHISDWIDCNSNGMLDVCDIVFAGDQCWHLDKVNCDVTVAFNPATKAKPNTWGWLKSLFR